MNTKKIQQVAELIKKRYPRTTVAEDWSGVDASGVYVSVDLPEIDGDASAGNYDDGSWYVFAKINTDNGHPCETVDINTGMAAGNGNPYEIAKRVVAFLDEIVEWGVRRKAA
jgi:hypothetical protein